MDVERCKIAFAFFYLIYYYQIPESQCLFIHVNDFLMQKTVFTSICYQFCLPDDLPVLLLSKGEHSFYLVKVDFNASVDACLVACKYMVHFHFGLAECDHKIIAQKSVIYFKRLSSWVSNCINKKGNPAKLEFSLTSI